MASALANGLTAATQQAQFDSIIQEFVSALRREGVADGYSSRHAGPARHFLTWLVRRDSPLRTVDGTVLDCFLQHDCDCCSGVPAAVLLHPSRKRRSSPEVMQFVRFLERTGRIDQPPAYPRRVPRALAWRGLRPRNDAGLPERRRGSDCLAPSVADPAAGPEPGGARTVPAETVRLFHPRRVLGPADAVSRDQLRDGSAWVSPLSRRDRPHRSRGAGVESQTYPWDRLDSWLDYLVTDSLGKRISPGETSVLALERTYWKP